MDAFELTHLGTGSEPIRAQHIDNCLDVGLVYGLPAIGQDARANRGSAIDGKRL